MKSILLALALLGVVSTIHAQVPPPPVLPNQPAQAPIDGGLGLLAAAGGVYALRKLRNQESGIGNRESGIGNRESGMIGEHRAHSKESSLIPDS